MAKRNRIELSCKVRQPKKPSKSKKRRRKRKQIPKEVCALCGEVFRKIPEEHLREHGYTRSMYARVFKTDGLSPVTTRTYNKNNQADTRTLQLTQEVARQIADDPVFVQTLADDVANAIVGGPLRDKIRFALVSVIAARLELQGRAATRLAAINEELAEEWRVKQGGEHGGPTDTKELTFMASQALQEMKTGEDLVLRAAKLAIDEMKVPPSPHQRGNPLDAFSGDAENLDVPAEIPNAEKEIIRELLTNLATANSRQIIDAESARPAECVVRETQPEQEDKILVESNIVPGENEPTAPSSSEALSASLSVPTPSTPNHTNDDEIDEQGPPQGLSVAELFPPQPDEPF